MEVLSISIFAPLSCCQGRLYGALLPQGARFAVASVIAAASFFEGYLITPLIQAKALSLPPVIPIFSILGFTLLFGTLGVILAAPLTVVLMIGLETAYSPEQEPFPERGP